MDAAGEVARVVAPGWVEPVEWMVPEGNPPGDGPVRFLVADLQRHLEEQSSFQHYVIQIANETGVEDYSQLEHRLSSRV